MTLLGVSACLGGYVGCAIQFWWLIWECCSVGAAMLAGSFCWGGKIGCVLLFGCPTVWVVMVSLSYCPAGRSQVWLGSPTHKHS